MKVQSEEMRDALSHLNGIVGSSLKSGMPDAVAVTAKGVFASNINDKIFVRLNIDAKEDEEYILPHGVSSLIFRNCEGEVTISGTEERVVVSGDNNGSGRFEYKIVCPSRNFASLNVGDVDAEASLGCPELSTAVSSVLPCVNKNDHRRVLTGVNFCQQGDKILVSGTDGKRMSVVMCDYHDADFQPFTISYNAAARMVAMGLSDMIVGSSYAVISGDEGEIGTTLINGRYPPVQNFIQGRKHKCEGVSLKEAQKSVRAACKMAVKDKDSAITLRLGRNSLVIMGGDVDVGTSSCDIDCSCEIDDSVVFCVNGSFLMSVLSLVKDDTFDISFSSPKDPIVINQGSDNPLVVTTIIRN